MAFEIQRITPVDYAAFEMSLNCVEAGHRMVLRENAAGKELRLTPQEELFAKFYNHEKLLVKDMDHIQLKEHREELQTIAFEAKARLVAADEEQKDRKAKTNNKEWLVTTDMTVKDSDAINVPKVRAARMSKMDKLKKQLRDSGIDEATVNEMIGNLEKKATESNLRTVTFSKPSTEIGAVQVKIEATPSEPFDPSSIKFGG